MEVIALFVVALFLVALLVVAAAVVLAFALPYEKSSLMIKIENLFTYIFPCRQWHLKVLRTSAIRKI